MRPSSAPLKKEDGVNVIRPDIAGLMGAYMALRHGKARAGENARSTVLTEEELRSFSQKVNDRAVRRLRQPLPACS